MGRAGRAAGEDTGDLTGAQPDEHVNQVHLVGRVSADPETRELPSGESMVCVRVVVGRGVVPESRVPGRRHTATVDTIDCAAWSPSARRSLLRWRAEDTVDVQGALRRRFWRREGGVASRYEIEVIHGKIVRKERR